MGDITGDGTYSATVRKAVDSVDKKSAANLQAVAIRALNNTSYLKTTLDATVTTANAAIPKATLTAQDDVLVASAASTPTVVNLAEQRLLGRVTGGHAAGLTGTQVASIISGSTITKTMSFAPSVSITTNGQAIVESNYGWQWFANKPGATSTVSIDGSGRLSVAWTTGTEDWFDTAVAGPGIYAQIPRFLLPTFDGQILTIYYTCTIAAESNISTGDWCRPMALLRGGLLSSTSINWFGAMLDASDTSRRVITYSTINGTTALNGFDSVDTSYFTTGTQHRIQVRWDGKIVHAYRKVGDSSWIEVTSNALNYLANTVVPTHIYFVVPKGGTVVSTTALISAISFELGVS